ncbi:malto-oligosyltrehalose synthase (plasmid) [Novosphingobium sp. BL-8A]|uniref:malto-oligosyltrehalose synthase n=1 Tax=Novosphingobium sp. BL-8A TaxID=3127639 RepID=UPI0037570B92
MVATIHKFPELVATYRLQLRGGTGFAEARAMLPWLTELGVSHLYLSPLFRAAAGSTHGYDVLDPNEVDPVLGGEEGFIALSNAALEAGIGLVLDIVPNHMAFTPENPFIADIMRRGRDSRFAQVFDLDWVQGPLHFPVLDGDPQSALAAGELASSPDGRALRVHGLDYPLRDTSLARALAAGEQRLDASVLSTLLKEQFWTIGDWRATADAIIHRRFFNITGLIGVKQEEADVFALTHRWIVDQVRAGRIQGLRIDHIDGLARPAAYLHRLREAVGEIPIWVEKIVKQDEELPHGWPVEGMSGYEFLDPLTRFLTEDAGLRTIRAACSDGVSAEPKEQVQAVRRELLETSLAPELRRVAGAALTALGCGAAEAPAIARAISDLGSRWPVYRSYTSDGYALASEMDDFRDGEDRTGWLLDLLHAAADDPAATVFAARFEQLTGALTAKSEEDTVFFRAVSYLPFCEVGIGPGLDPIDAAAFEASMQKREETSPLALSTLSTHDTKRSADARAALIALTYMPDLALVFIQRTLEDARASDVPARWGVYALQSALALRGEPEAGERLAGHIAKAMREAKDLSCHEKPDVAAEGRVGQLAEALRGMVERIDAWPDGALARFEQIYDRIVLAQVAFQITAPGIPDIYQGNEIVAVNVTDPDNRRPIAEISHASVVGGSLSDRKLRLTQDLLNSRRRHRDIFIRGNYTLYDTGKSWVVNRSLDGRVFEVNIEKPDAAQQR